MTEAQIKAIIDENIRTNGREEITGAIANNVLNAMVDYTATVVTPTIDVSGAIAVGQVSTAVNGDKIARYLPTKSITKFDSNYAGLVGGYSQGNIVIHNDEIYVSEINNNLTTPVTSSITWRKLSSGGYTLPTASTTVLGGVKIDGITITKNANGQLVASGGDNYQIENIALSAWNENLVAGLDVYGFRVLKAFTISEFKIGVGEAPTGSQLIIGIKKNGVIVTTTPASIAPNQTDSTTTTQPVFSSNSFAIGDFISFYIPAGGVGSVNTGKNLVANLKIQYS